MYNIKEIIDKAGGREYIKHLIEDEGYTYEELKIVLNTKASNRTTLRKFIDYCNAEIPFPKVTKSRKWMLYWIKYGIEYWTNDYLVEQIMDKLNHPILNIAGAHKRYNISMWGHPNANKQSFQVRAHQIVWELDNECFLPEGYEIQALDNNYLNLDLTNLVVRTTLSRKSFYASGERNHFYTGTPRYINYTRGWNRISKDCRDRVGKCEVCDSINNSLNTHHIISYWLFEDNDLRVHSNNNLIVVCDSCHGKIHQNKIQIVPHISEMKYKNLLELLESLKSQVPDTLMETYKCVEKQLGLTDNQQPSTV